MKVRNRNTGSEYETTEEEFNRLVVNQGNAYKYEVVESDVPIEVRSLREMKLKKQIPGTITEVILDESPVDDQKQKGRKNKT